MKKGYWESMGKRWFEVHWIEEKKLHKMRLEMVIKTMHEVLFLSEKDERRSLPPDRFFTIIGKFHPKPKCDTIFVFSAKSWVEQATIEFLRGSYGTFYSRCPWLQSWIIPSILYFDPPGSRRCLFPNLSPQFCRAHQGLQDALFGF